MCVDKLEVCNCRMCVDKLEECNCIMCVNFSSVIVKWLYINYIMGVDKLS